MDVPAALQRRPEPALGAERDTIFDRRQVEATARAYKTAAKMLPGVAHDAMLDAGWCSTADAISDWLKTALRLARPWRQPLFDTVSLSPGSPAPLPARCRGC